MNSNKLIERIGQALDATERRAPIGSLDCGDRTAAGEEKKKRNTKLDLLIRKVLSRGIDPHWLLTGEGCMYRKECYADARREEHELRKMEQVLCKVYYKLRTVG
jgi:hypothetical protein